MERNNREIEYQYDANSRLNAEIWLDEANKPVRSPDLVGWVKRSKTQQQKLW